MGAQSANKILILDSEDFHRQMLNALLQLKGFEVIGLEDASELEGSLKKFLPQIILLDLDFPHPSLIELIKVFSKLKIPVIAMTHTKPPEALKEALSAGAIDIISKDFFRMEKFVQSLQKAIELAQLNEERKQQLLKEQKRKAQALKKPAEVKEDVTVVEASESSKQDEALDKFISSILPNTIRPAINKDTLMENMQSRLLTGQLNKRLYVFYELLLITSKGTVQNLAQFLLGRDKLVDSLRLCAKNLDLPNGGEVLSILKELGFPFSSELCCYFYLMECFPCQKSKISRLLFWSHTISSATLCKHVSIAADYEKGEYLSLIAMLHNIGRAYLISYEPEVIQAIDQVQKDYPGVDIKEVERKLLPIGHEEIGAHLLQHSNYPSDIYQTIRYHHANPSMLKGHGEIDLKLLKILQGCNRILEKDHLDGLVAKKGSPVLEQVMKMTRRSDERFAHRVFVDAKHECLKVFFLLLQDSLQTESA